MIDFLLLLARHKRLVVVFPVTTALLATLSSFLLPNIYTATARMLPPQQNANVAAALLSQLGGFGQLVAQSSGLKNPGELYIGMLQSRTIADSLISRFDFQKLYDENTLTDTRKKLAKRTTIFSGRDGLIVIEFEDNDAKRAADVANAYVEELQNLSQTLAVTEAAQRRLFFSKQLTQTKDDLAKAEMAFRRAQEGTGLLKLDDQSRAIIESVARLRAEIASKEVQLQAMQTFSTPSNPEFVLIGKQLTALRDQLLKLEQGKSEARGNVLVPTGQIPEAGLEYVRRLRDLKYSETLFELMAKQFELAKVDEARDMSLVQVVDVAVVPDKRSWPKRSVIVILTFAISLSLGIVIVLIAEAHQQALADPNISPKYRSLLKQLSALSRR